MRIATNYQYDTFQFDIANATERLSKVSRELSTGKKITQPSDDPFGVGQTINMRSLQAGMEQYSTNLKMAKGTLGYTDSTASDMSDLMKRAYSLAVSGASSTTDQTGRNAMASEIASIQTRLLDLANTKGPNGNYLFAGQKSTTKPYTLVGTTLTFNGDTNKVVVEAGPGEMMTINTPGEPMISDMYNRLETLKNDLTGGQVGAISGVDIANMQSSLDAINSVRGDVGSRMRSIDDLTSQWQRRSDDLTTNISDVEDVDMAEAALRYQQAQQAYSAALTVAGQGFRLSLMDFIK
jgi:flagellar hook-associated protein 3 FlgL